MFGKTTMSSRGTSSKVLTISSLRWFQSCHAVTIPIELRYFSLHSPRIDYGQRHGRAPERPADPAVRRANLRRIVAALPPLPAPAPARARADRRSRPASAWCRRSCSAQSSTRRIPEREHRAADGARARDDRDRDRHRRARRLADATSRTRSASASCTTSARRSTATCSGCRSRSSRARGPARCSRGSPTTSAACRASSRRRRRRSSPT